MKQIVLLDFDGTIIVEDSALLVLKRYGSGNWRKYDDQLLKGEISLEECLSKQFSLINATQADIIHVLDGNIAFRPNFKNFVLFCEKFQIPRVILSAGLDFVIEHFLKRLKLNYPIPIVSGTTKFDFNGISFKFPELKFPESNNFKEDLVIRYKTLGYSVTYIGDGSGDFYAVKRADTAFIVENSELARICTENEIRFHNFLDFNSIIRNLRTP